MCLGLVVSVLAVAIELTAALAREERYAGRAGRARILLVRILLCAAAWFALFLLLCVEAAIRGALLA